MKNEKRKSRRLVIDEQIRIQFGAHRTVGRGRDLSEGGLMFESNREFATGDSVTVTFELSKTILIELEARIARVSSSSHGKKIIGAQFVESDQRHAKHLFAYLENQVSY